MKGTVIVKDGDIPENIQGIVTWLPGSNAHSREKAFEKFGSKGIETYIIMGAILCKIRDEKDWEKFHCNSMRDYCESNARPTMSYTQSLRMMSIWDEFKNEIMNDFETIKRIPFMNLFELSRIKSKLNQQQIDNLLEQAAETTERGFKDNLREAEGKPTSDTCDHMNADKWFYKCKRCNKIIGIDWPDVKLRVETENG